MKLGAFLLMLMLIGAASAVHAQTSNEPPIKIEEVIFDCSGTTEYLDKNKEPKKTLTVRLLKGVTVLYAAENIIPDSDRFYEGACVALFTEKEHKFVAKTVSGKNGKFTLENIADGDYRLVIIHRYGTTNVANIPIRISKSKGKPNRIMIYMIGNNFPNDSFVKLK